MPENGDSDKILQFERGVVQSTVKSDDGSTEKISSAYTIYLASHAIVTLYGTNRATATEYKRIADHGFTKAEIKLIFNGEPFSNNPKVDCDRVISSFRSSELMMMMDLGSFLKNLLKSIRSKTKDVPASHRNSSVNICKTVNRYGKLFRLPGNLKIAEMSRQLQLTGDIEADEKNVIEIINSIAENKIRKFPG